MSIAFLITNPYQLFHYKWIASHFRDITALLEIRDTDFGLNEALVQEHLPHAKIEYTSKPRMTDLDGRFDAIVCQTPILPLEFLKETYIVAQQYSLAKETYQYGAWRANAHLNLMYGNYSVQKVQGFTNAVAVGNPLFDPYFNHAAPPSEMATPTSLHRQRILYLPTYGELSSLDSVLPRLGEIDATITVKLHHMQARNEFADLPNDVTVVRSNTDPIALLRSTDAVISDFSGSAFDALYAGLPLILTGHANPQTTDYSRLSAEEREAHALADVAATWGPGIAFDEALALAQELVKSPRRQTLVDEYFVNSGAAGAACAEEIRSLIEDGEPSHFGARQVRETTKRYILANRDLRSRLKRLKSTGSLGPVSEPPRQSGGFSSQPSISRRLRRRLGQMPIGRQLVRMIRRSQGRPSAAQAAPVLPVVPRERREAIWEMLSHPFVEAGVRAVRYDQEPGADAAVLDADLEAVHVALHKVATSHPDLTIDVKADKATVRSVPIGSVTLADLHEARWFQVGYNQEVGTYQLGKDGHLTILVVQYDTDRSRYLSLYGRAQRVDWTSSFADGLPSTRAVTRSANPRTMDAAGPHTAAPIDVVYTWVDSTDPEWRKLHSYHSTDHVTHNESANNDERYIDREELRYSLRSIWMFAPFVRNIYIVTANQRPTWLSNDPRITIVPHTEIFPDSSVLPTFNSHAIEACLHRIDGLSEDFLYFNDDMLLGRETYESDFFTISGMAKSRLSPSQFIYDGRPNESAIPTDWAAYNAVSLLERDYAIHFSRKMMHVPYPLKLSVMHEIEERYPDEVTRTRAARFRAPTDIAIPSMFGQYYAIATARATEWKPAKNEYVYLDTGRAISYARYESILKKRPKFFCLNSTRYNEVDLETQAAYLKEFLSGAFPSAAPWEADPSPESVDVAQGGL